PTTEAGNITPTGTEYTWTIPNIPGNIAGASDATTPQTIISQTLVNSGETDVTIIYRVTPIYNGCLGTPFEVTVTVTAPINVTATITNATCFKDVVNDTFLGNGAIEITISGGTPFIVPTDQSTAYTTSWTSNTPEGYASSDPDITGLQAGDYTLTVTDKAGKFIKKDYTITQPTIDSIIDPNNTSICIGDTPEQLVVSYTGGLGTPVYQWYRNTTGTNTPGTSDAIIDANGNVYTPLPEDLTPNTINYFFATIELVGCSPVASEVFTIETQASPTITTQPLASQEVCIEGIAETLEIAAATSASSNTITVQWYANTTGILPADPVVDEIIGATANAYTPETETVGTTYYYAIVQGTTACVTISNIAQVTVKLALETTITPNTPQTVCEGEEVTLNVAALNGEGTASYQWYEAQNGAVTNAINATFTVPTDTAGTKAYYAIVTYDQGPCTTITTEIVSIVVTETPVIADGAVTSYTGAPFTYNPATNTSNTVPAGTQYTWTFTNPGNVTGPTAETVPANAIIQTLTNTGTTDITIIYTVTPTYNGCLGLPFQLSVTVTAPLKVVETITNASCFNSNVSTNNGSIFITISGGISPYTTVWTAPNGYSSTASGILDTASIAALEGGVYTLNIIDSIGNPFEVTYTLTEPTIDPILDDEQTICFDGTSAPLVVTYKDGLSTPIYQWYEN
ncbi:MAG: PKD-like domain-containing protein, partial [Flavobacteriales bacterium]